MAMLKSQAVTNPMATVPQMAMGIIFSGLATSSAKWTAQSKQVKAQFVLIRPMMNAIPPLSQPVLLMKVAKTNLAVWCVRALAGTTIIMMMKDRSEM